MNAQTLSQAIKNLLPLLTADFNALEPWQAEIDDLLHLLAEENETESPHPLLDLEAHLDHLSHEDILIGGAGLSDTETKYLLDLAGQKPLFYAWLAQTDDLDLIFSWMIQTVQPEAVDLIASGYEWICPVCNTLNHEIETKNAVTCATCQSELGTDETHHAFG